MLTLVVATVIELEMDLLKFDRPCKVKLVKKNPRKATESAMCANLFPG